MFDFLAEELECRSVERSLKKGCQFDHGIGKKISCFYVNARSMRNKCLDSRIMFLFSFIFNPSFIGTGFQVIKYVLECKLYID